MARSIADETERRRGLVLGLTLAELLLLLLFLLILILGSRVERIEHLREAAEAKARNIEQVRLLWEQLKDRPDFNLEVSQLVEQLAQLEAIKTEAQTLRDTNAVLERELSIEGEAGKDLGSLEDALELAQQIDPAAPPAVLKRAVEVLHKLGTGVQPEQVRPLSELLEAQEQLQAAEARLQEANAPGHQWPPIINLSEADGYFFERGKADLTSGFQRQLSGAVVPKLAEIAKEYQVDVIEVVGHTDEQPIVERPSNLDQSLVGVLQRRLPVSALVPADNSGLGLSRAAAVVRSLSADARLRGLRIIPLSAAQLVLTDGTLSDGSNRGDVRERRRIEIRMRRSQ